MKRIIDGKTYNTETATLIGTYGNGLSRSDFGFLDKGLYLTKKGRFFLAGEGGAMTEYSESYGGMSSEGEGITVLSEAEALTWAERHADIDMIEKHFTVEEG